MRKHGLDVELTSESKIRRLIILRREKSHVGFVSKMNPTKKKTRRLVELQDLGFSQLEYSQIIFRPCSKKYLYMFNISFRVITIN